MIDWLAAFAQEVAIPNSAGGVYAAAAGILAAAGGVWAWVKGELNDCKKDRLDLYKRLDQMHETVSNLSLSVGRLEGSGGGSNPRSKS